MVPVPMSVAWSVDAVKDRRKTVTRRPLDDILCRRVEWRYLD